MRRFLFLVGTLGSIFLTDVACVTIGPGPRTLTIVGGVPTWTADVWDLSDPTRNDLLQSYTYEGLCYNLGNPNVNLLTV